MKIIRHITILFAIATFIGCGSGDGKKTKDTSGEEKDGDQASKKNEEPLSFRFRESNAVVPESIDQQIKTVLEETKDCGKFRASAINPPTPCEFVSASVPMPKNKRFSWTGEKVKVLVIDSFGALAVSRYANRISEHYNLGADGSYKKSEYTLSIPKGYAKITREILNGNTFYTSDDLKDYSDAIDQQFNLSDTSHGHGEMVLNIIAEYTPSAEIFLASIDNEPKYVICPEPGDIGPEVYYDNMFNSLSKAISENGIQYINMSGGYDRIIAHKLWDLQCGDLPIDSEKVDAFLAADAAFLKKLSELETTIFIQAGLDVSSPDELTPYASPGDCPEEDFKNRIRVLSYHSPDAMTPKGGTLFSDLVKSNVARDRAAKICSDVIINGGIGLGYPPEVGKHPLLVTGKGFSVVSIPIFTTSFAAPLMVSNLIYLQKTQYKDREFDASLVSDIVSRFKSEFLMVDPLAHGSFEVNVFTQSNEQTSGQSAVQGGS